MPTKKIIKYLRTVHPEKKTGNQRELTLMDSTNTSKFRSEWKYEVSETRWGEHMECWFFKTYEEAAIFYMNWVKARVEAEQNA